jgi:hypothetical protein
MTSTNTLHGLAIRRVQVAGLMLVILLTTTCLTRAQEAARQQPDSSTKHVRLLTIGNSFSRNATRFLNDLVEADGQQLTHRSIVVGGASLQLHADQALAFEKDPQAKNGVYSNGLSLQQELQAGDWDYVSIQQASIKSHDIATYRPYAAQLKRLVDRYAPMADLLVHQTWAYRMDDPRFGKPDGTPPEPNSHAEMYQGLTNAYATIARELGVRRIPVGDAFYMADTHATYGYQPDTAFDLSQAKYPALPNQEHSLHVGWRWRKAGDPPQWSLNMDGHHANLAGEYLGACVWYEMLFERSSVGNRFVPPELKREYATFLQQTAHRAVQAAAETDEHAAQRPSPALAFVDPTPQQYRLQARASALDKRVREYPEIGFVFGSDEKPQDMQHASVDTRVAPQGKLVIWLMGHNEALFDRLNSYGLHAIQVSYANKWFGTLCRPKPATSRARGDVRLEAATGEDFSSELNLQPADGMMQRAVQLVKWLAAENPQAGWDYFLRDDGQDLRWDRVIISGSSHGSTTAARFAMHQRVDRVVMLCGPRDQDQDWQAGPSATPANRFFGFSHVLDGGWTGDHYCRSWELLGLHQYGPIVNVDQAHAPYGDTRRLISAADVNEDANRAHSSVTPGRASPKGEDDQFLFEPVWKYLYLHPVESTGSPTEKDADCVVKER